MMCSRSSSSFFWAMYALILVVSMAVLSSAWGSAATHGGSGHPGEGSTERPGLQDESPLDEDTHPMAVARQSMDQVIQDLLSGRLLATLREEPTLAEAMDITTPHEPPPVDKEARKTAQGEEGDRRGPRITRSNRSTRSPSGKRQSKQHVSYEGHLNLNTATVDELTFLPGIGRGRATAIVTYRLARPFRHPRHILRVDGISHNQYAALRPYLTVEGPTTLRKIITLVSSEASSSRSDS